MNTIVSDTSARSELIALLRREGQYSGVWFGDKLIEAADALTSLPSPEGEWVLVPRELSDWMRGEGMRAHMDALYVGKKTVNEGMADGLKAVEVMWPALLAAAARDARRAPPAMLSATPSSDGERG